MRLLVTIALLSLPVPATAQEVSPNAALPVTVVAVVDGAGYTPYHYAFVGHQHPWNRDADPSNDIDFAADPAGYVEGHPGAHPISLTLPSSPFNRIDLLRNGTDASAWAQFERSTPDDVNMYWFPGTKIIGAVSFSSGGEAFYGDAEAHGTRTAASLAGNHLGTCETCLFVLVKGNGPDALRWAASQSWIDVVVNSYGHGQYTTNDPARHDPTGRVPRSVVRDNIYFDSPISTTREASERGQVITFSAGNGFLNAFDVPILTYWSSEKGPDWIVTVGAVSSTGKQTALGSGKPVDISSIGDSYPSTGQIFANGRGSHSGTSNASPVVGGYFARTLQHARELLSDTTSGHSGGVVASGAALGCGEADGCPIGDGILTRSELEKIVFHAARPSAQVVGDVPFYPTVPTTEHAYAYQGHGVLAGRIDGADGHEAEAAHMAAVLTGSADPYARPPGEANWFVVDSKCRQKFWGTWSGGSYTGTDPALDPQADPLATAFNGWCSPLPDGFAAALAPEG